jgi:hypothetical protein
MQRPQKIVEPLVGPKPLCYRDHPRVKLRSRVSSSTCCLGRPCSPPRSPARFGPHPADFVAEVVDGLKKR